MRQGSQISTSGPNCFQARGPSLLELPHRDSPDQPVGALVNQRHVTVQQTRGHLRQDLNASPRFQTLKKLGLATVADYTFESPNWDPSKVETKACSQCAKNCVCKARRSLNLWVAVDRVQNRDCNMLMLFAPKHACGVAGKKADKTKMAALTPSKAGIRWLASRGICTITGV